MKFLSNTHQQNYDMLIARAKVHPQDNERQSFFYILAGCDLYDNADSLYDFDENWIKLIGFDEDENCYIFPSYFTGSTRGLYRLAVNLYNGNTDSRCSVLNCFANLDTDYFMLALEAIKIRFNKA